jgi:hypothetical protein
MYLKIKCSLKTSHVGIQWETNYDKQYNLSILQEPEALPTFNMEAKESSKDEECAAICKLLLGMEEYQDINPYI